MADCYFAACRHGQEDFLDMVEPAEEKERHDRTFEILAVEANLSWIYASLSDKPSEGLYRVS